MRYCFYAVVANRACPVAPSIGSKVDHRIPTRVMSCRAASSNHGVDEPGQPEHSVPKQDRVPSGASRKLIRVHLCIFIQA